MDTGILRDIYVYISAVFPRYRLEQLRAMSVDELIMHLAIAEKVLGREIELP